jgi:hypothetical protein
MGFSFKTLPYPIVTQIETYFYPTEKHHIKDDLKVNVIVIIQLYVLLVYFTSIANDII